MLVVEIQGKVEGEGVAARLDFVISRRGLDPAAETCEAALRDLLGLPVAGVERADMLRFEFTSTPAATSEHLRSRLEAAARRAGRYVNTNRDVCAWPVGPRPYPEAAPRDGWAVDVWVTHGDGEDPVAAGHFRPAVGPELRSVRSGVLWRLWLAAADADAARELALAIAITHGRRQGLLANPHAQSVEIVSVVPGPAAAKEAS
jgi:phosphoribosylformylglycinamidine (FGAM) synthase PurS component